MIHLADLNKYQKDAVITIEGPVLVIAGAGSGKTKTITYRILHLILQGVSPEKILAVTFTNKAAREMKERVEVLLKNLSCQQIYFSKNQPKVCTFHVLGASIIRENALIIGLTRNFSIFDRENSLRAVKQGLKDIGLDPKQYDPEKFIYAISRIKNSAVGYEEFDNNSTGFNKVIARVWGKYRDILKQEQALDFDDLLLESLIILQNNEKIRTHYQNTWSYMHVDEYQDTNIVQAKLVNILSGTHRNIFVVGDSDQLIYSWRGADIRNILSFEETYSEAKVFLLEENYRSTKNILDAANSIISKNKLRDSKSLFTKNKIGNKISIYTAVDEYDEARFTALKCAEFISKGCAPTEIAVLLRANFQSRALEEAFLGFGVPYQVVGVRFFDRKEIKDIIAYIKVALNPQNRADFIRIVNTPPRGLGKVALVKILSGKESELLRTASEGLNSLKKIFEKIVDFSKNSKLSDLIMFVYRESGIGNQLKNGDPYDHERILNIQELSAFAKRYEEHSPDEALNRFLDDIVLASEQDGLIKNENSVKLMTVHSAKGLEFKNVFITGLEGDLFPLRKGDMTQEEREEERRLFYVALTRAREKVILTFASSRAVFGSRRLNTPSEFITDIDERLLEVEDVGDFENAHKFNVGKKEETIYF